jgi:EmrB/QacA subfamily drug resistance transporter
MNSSPDRAVPASPIFDPAAARAVLIASCVASFTTPFLGSAVNIAMPRIANEFSMDTVTLGWVATSYLLAAAMVLLPFGRLADIHGRKRMFLLGLAVQIAASALAPFSTTSGFLIACRVMQGVGGGMVFGTGVAILVSVYPPKDRGRVLGINVAAVYLGLSLGPFAGGFLTSHFGWRSIFFTVALLCVAAMALVLLKLKSEWAEARGERFDIAGSVLYGIPLAALMYGFSRLPGTLGAWLTVAGAAGIAFFVWHQSRTASPLIDTALFRSSSVFAFSNLAALINYSATFAVGFLLSLYLQYVKGLDPQSAGLMLVAQPLMMTAVSPMAGRLSDRMEPRLVASIGMAIIVVGLVLCALIDQDSTALTIVPDLALLGLGFGLFSSPNTNAVMSSVERKSYSVASATLGTMRLTGQMLSMGIVMMIFAVTLGKTKITPEISLRFVEALRIAFVVFAALAMVGVFASMVRGKVQREE